MNYYIHMLHQREIDAPTKWINKRGKGYRNAEKRPVRCFHFFTCKEIIQSIDPNKYYEVN
ncbi:hypothetical protein [uncultured Apibacter sp.]|uniref:hypothetical protein n=1 Tax=uncultured Apibacter sp. TaxID=1778616 RepID=UPI0025E0E960|nr:hypothetical protein [uncultured Apibacter sp.]